MNERPALPSGQDESEPDSEEEGVHYYAKKLVVGELDADDPATLYIHRVVGWHQIGSSRIIDRDRTYTITESGYGHAKAFAEQLLSEGRGVTIFRSPLRWEEVDVLLPGAGT